jgi:hypothetical protein
MMDFTVRLSALRLSALRLIQPTFPRIYPPAKPNQKLFPLLTQTFNKQGKAKRKRWQEVVDAGTSQADAEKKYITLGEGLIAKHK